MADTNTDLNTQDTSQEDIQPDEVATVDETVDFVEDASSNNKVSAIQDFNVGDTIKVHYKIIEGEKTRIQPYEGIVIARQGSGISKTFMVRRIGADGIGVERIFALHSPNITKLEVLKRGKVRRAKLYYLRQKKGRAATKVKELVTAKN